MDVISHFIKVTRCHYSWWNLVEPINGFWREILCLTFWKSHIPNIWYLILLLFFEKELPKQKILSLSLTKTVALSRQRKNFSSFFFIASTLRIKGGDRETTLELGIHKAWSFHPLHHLGRNFKDPWSFNLCSSSSSLSFVSMIPPCFKFITYSSYCISHA